METKREVWLLRTCFGIAPVNVAFMLPNVAFMLRSFRRFTLHYIWSFLCGGIWDLQDRDSRLRTAGCLLYAVLLFGNDACTVYLSEALMENGLLPAVCRFYSTSVHAWLERTTGGKWFEWTNAEA